MTPSLPPVMALGLPPWHPQGKGLGSGGRLVGGPLDLPLALVLWQGRALALGRGGLGLQPGPHHMSMHGLEQQRMLVMVHGLALWLLRVLAACTQGLGPATPGTLMAAMVLSLRQPQAVV